MSMTSGVRRPLAAVAAAVFWALPGASAAHHDPSYAALLERHTREVPDTAGTRVDYASLRASRDWRALVSALADHDPAELASREERLAFWINAYNILAIDVGRAKGRAGREHPRSWAR